ncbi:hypothetical protein K490DRAFT_53481 [Saccharata proteae CBS 121410]|uniref:Uncharacterized protein n=1 Tax=Saccharata proteae CBS 121410 TaxID=1314787 RepID=A0A9P4HWH9_9PEZI|nr:hypothetical protein K490DRAFT_53481 [Saccharata proteae CBS 121410]
MKVREPASDREAEIIIEADGRQCEEYVPGSKSNADASSPWWDDDGALCCWTAVGTDQKVIIRCRISASVAKRGGVIDILVDGVHRICQKFGGRNTSEKAHTIPFPALLSKKDGVVHKCPMRTSYLQDERPEVYGKVGTIEFRMSLLDPDRPNAEHAMTDLSNFSWDDLYDPRATGGEQLVRPTHHIEFLHEEATIPFKSEISRNRYLAKLPDKRHVDVASLSSDDEDSESHVSYEPRDITEKARAIRERFTLTERGSDERSGRGPATRESSETLPSPSDTPALGTVDATVNDDTTAGMTQQPGLVDDRAAAEIGTRTVVNNTKLEEDPREHLHNVEEAQPLVNTDKDSAPAVHEAGSRQSPIAPVAPKATVASDLGNLMDCSSAAKPSALNVSGAAVSKGTDTGSNVGKDNASELDGTEPRQRLTAPVTPMVTAASKPQNFMDFSSNTTLGSFNVSGAASFKRSSTSSEAGTAKKPKTDFGTLERKVAELQQSVKESQMKKLEAERKAADSEQRREAAILKHIAALEKKNQEAEQLAQKALPQEEAEQNERFIRELDATHATDDELNEQDG